MKINFKIIKIILTIFSIYYMNSSFGYKVSILTSVYKGQQFIKGFLEDITKQTIFNQCELIIINANSPENEEPIILEYKNKYPNNIVYKKLNYDPGLFGVWNMAIKMSSAEYVTNANIDDRLKHNSLEMHAKYLDEHPDIDLVYSGCYVTRKANETFAKNSSNNHILAHSILDFDRKKQLLNWIPYVNNHPMWKKSLHQKYGLFNEKRYKCTGGMDFWIRCTICGNAKFKRIDGVYSLYYWNPQGISTRKNNLGKEERPYIRNMFTKLYHTYYKDIEFLKSLRK